MSIISNIKIEEIKIKKTPELEKLVKLMEKHGYTDCYNMLPNTPKHQVSFELNSVSSSFANGIRRVLVEEIPVRCLHIEEADISTDDEFILGMVDVLIKNINLVPIEQDLPFGKTSISLSLHNNTNETLDIKARDFKFSNGLTLDKLIPDSNILLMRLRPGKYIKLEKLYILEGTSAENAARFSLLNNITYKPLDIEPFDHFTGKGTRSIEHDCRKFHIGFTTCGNISVKSVMEKVKNVIISYMTDIKQKIQLYTEQKNPGYYSGQDLEVNVSDETYNYKLTGHYITPIAMIARKCYDLDPNVPFCTSTVERFDSKIGIIRIKHVDPNKLLISAIDACIEDIEKVYAGFKK